MKKKSSTGGMKVLFFSRWWPRQMLPTHSTLSILTPSCQLSLSFSLTFALILLLLLTHILTPFMSDATLFLTHLRSHCSLSLSHLLTHQLLSLFLALTHSLSHSLSLTFSHRLLFIQRRNESKSVAAKKSPQRGRNFSIRQSTTTQTF